MPAADNPQRFKRVDHPCECGSLVLVLGARTGWDLTENRPIPRADGLAFFYCEQCGVGVIYPMNEIGQKTMASGDWCCDKPDCGGNPVKAGLV